MTLAEWLKKNGYTHEEAAPLLGLRHPQQVSALVRGENSPTLRTVDRIAVRTEYEVTRLDWPDWSEG